MTRHLYRLALVAAVLSITSSASAWEYITPQRSHWCDDIAPYQINEIGSVDIGAEATIRIVQQAMNDWAAVPNSAFEANYMGLVPGSTNPLSNDGMSVVGWFETSWPDSSSAIGVTRIPVIPCMNEVSMIMNGVHFTWSEGPGMGSVVNTYSITLHEFGHWIGFGHSTRGDNPIMYFAYSGGIGALSDSDKEGLRTLYPGMDVPSGCTSDADCPGDQVCQADGTCLPPSGGMMGGCMTNADCVGDPAGPVCEADGTCGPMTGGMDPGMMGGGGAPCTVCNSNTDCGGLNDLCMNYSPGTFCGRSCTSASECPDTTYQCLEVGAGVRQCIRQVDGAFSCTAMAGGGMDPPPMMGTPGCTNDSQCLPSEFCNVTTGDCVMRTMTGAGTGEACTLASDCASNTCIAGVCVQTCDYLDPLSCPGGFYCDGRATGLCGDGICKEGSPGLTGQGGACSADTECQSLYCSDGICTVPCDVNAIRGCPAGLVCQVAASGGCGACTEAGVLGDTCEDDSDCSTRYCVRNPAGDRFCTDPCSTETPCPVGFLCVSVTPTQAICERIPREPGLLGDSCTANDQCQSGQCICADMDDCWCTRPCGQEQSCPGGFVCTDTGTGAFCEPFNGVNGGDGEGCGCRTVSDDSRPWGLLLIAAPLFLLMRRRRR